MIGVAWRVPLLVLAFLSLLVGMTAGLARLGLPVPMWAGRLAALHGPLMVCGFFGTVISLERAVALARRWAYLAPLLSGAGAAAALSGVVPPAIGAGLIAAGSAILAAASLLIYARQRELFTLTLALGALSWLLGNLQWLAGLPIHAIVPAWLAFFVLTIAGERLELSRLLPPSAVARRIFAITLILLLGAVALSLRDERTGRLLLAVALLAIAAWLMRQDVARRTVRSRGLTRFIAVCLLSGYAWLAVAGITLLAWLGLGDRIAAYDAALHAVLLGFVFSMVFGHAPIIFPAILRIAVPYAAYFYVPLVILHASLLLRVAGDWTLRADWRAWGGALNGVALLAFIAGTIAAVVRGRVASAAGRAQRLTP
jgi:hypothetical protein